jgi:hypothetical protein
MTDQHRANPELWAAAEKFSQNSMDMLNCMLELRSRIEALEAAQLEQAESNRFCTDAIVRRVEALEAPMTEVRAASAEVRPAGLVERVARSIERTVDFNPDSYAPEACAAIREVAKWLDTKGQHGCSLWLREEANRG